MTDTPAQFTLFDTVIGRCGIAWNERGILRVQFPGANDATTQKRLLSGIRAAEAATVPAIVRDSIAGVVALIAGEPTDLSAIPVDLEGVSEFHQRVYQVIRRVPPGSTVTYGEVAAQVGDPGAARAVGRALGENPVPIIIPCHRVVAAGGRIGGFSGSG